MLISSQSTAQVLQLFTPECRVFVSDYYPTAQVILSSDWSISPMQSASQRYALLSSFSFRSCVRYVSYSPVLRMALYNENPQMDGQLI